MSKLYFVIPDVALAERIVGDLLQHGATDEDIGVLGNSDLLVSDLPEADIGQATDVKPAIKQGTVVGGATGLLAGLAATVIPGGFAIGGAGLLGMALGGSAFGAWVSGMVGVSVSNREVEEFRSAIRRGHLLMIVNTEHLDREDAKRLVSDRHPEVRYGGEEGDVKSVA